MKLLAVGRLAAASSTRAALVCVGLAGALLGGSQGTQDAVANGDTRTISIYHTHTNETVAVTFRRNGQYDERGLEQLNWVLRDWRSDEPTRMDPRLFDILWAVHRETGSGEAIHIVSAYRSPATNAMLRRRSTGVAENSQHMRGKAVDFFLPDVAIDRVRAVGMRLQYGGVGYYPTSYNPFVHLDVGSVRAWPRMTRDQLVRLFPDGKTVHLPTDGRPLPGYQEARADVLARGGTVAGVSAYASADPVPGRSTQRRSFWASLFGGDEDEDLQAMRSARPMRRAQRVRVASAAPGEDESPSSALLAYNAAREPQRRPTPVAAMPDPLIGGALAPAAVAPAAPAAVPIRTAALSPNNEIAAGAPPPIPPRRPDDVVATGALVSSPTPPSRPDLPPVGPANSGEAVPERPGPAAVVFAAIAHPLPPARPAQPIQVAAVGPITLPAAPAAAPAPALLKEEREHLRALFAQALTAQAVPTRATRTTVAAVRIEKAMPPGALARGPILALGFSTKPADLAADRFSGPAVKPLPVLR